MKTYWGVEVCLHAFQTSTIDGHLSASHSGLFTPKDASYTFSKQRNFLPKQTERFWEQCLGNLDLKGRKMNCGENCIMMNFIACILQWILLGWGEWGREGRGVYSVSVGKPEGKRPLERRRLMWGITLRWTLGRYGSMGRTGFGWLRIESSGGLLWTRWWTFGFRKKAGYFW